MTSPNPIFSRRRDLDVARELIVASLIFFHTARIFDDMGFYVKNEPQGPALTFVVILTVLWGMPLLFVIAGFAIWHSLQKRTAFAFVCERLQRLFVPFIVGLLIIVPPQIYFGLNHHHHLWLSGDQVYNESYTQFYLRFFDIRFKIDFPWVFSASPDTGFFGAAHLWFLYDLLVFTLLLLPVFLYLRQPRGRELTARFVKFFNRSWRVFLLGLPIAVIEAALGTEDTGGWNQSAYIVFLLYGYLFAADARLRSAICESRKSGIILAVVLTAMGLTGFAIHSELAHTDPSQAYDLASMMLRFSKGFIGWCWILAILGFLEHARNTRKITKNLHDSQYEPGALHHKQGFLTRLERYAHKAVLPFYILHQTVIVAIGYYVVQWQIGALLKFMIISLAALVITLLLYETLVKRTRLTRFLFGMKAQKMPYIKDIA